MTLPLWTRDELVLAMSAAVTKKAERVRMRDPDVIALSRLLRAAAGDTDEQDHRSRNPHGVARKIWRFVARLDGDVASLQTPMERAVWDEFADDPEALLAAAADARVRLLAAGQPALPPSRGPVPFVGDMVSRRGESPAWVYLAALDGMSLASGHAVLKVGRSIDPPRRRAELNFALPRVLGVRWKVVATWKFDSQVRAHEAEQAILSAQAAEKRTAGGEFLLIRPQCLGAVLAECAAVIAAIDSTAVLEARTGWAFAPQADPNLPELVRYRHANL